MESYEVKSSQRLVGTVQENLAQTQANRERKTKADENKKSKKIQEHPSVRK